MWPKVSEPVAYEESNHMSTRTQAGARRVLGERQACMEYQKNLCKSRMAVPWEVA